MFIKLQLFGGGGAPSGGSFRGSKQPSYTGTPNSKYTQYKDGKKFQERWYDHDGRPKKDKDHTDHGKPKQHPHTPHYHDWDGNVRSGGYWIDENGEKHYFNETKR